MLNELPGVCVFWCAGAADEFICGSLSNQNPQTSSTQLGPAAAMAAAFLIMR